MGKKALNKQKITYSNGKLHQKLVNIIKIPDNHK